MKKFYYLIFAFLFLLATSASSLAGDYATLNFIGFSKDGKFLAFEEYGSQDGSGYPYSNYFFVNVQNNTYAAPPIMIRIDRDTATETQARTRAATAAAKKLRELKIAKGNLGKHVVSRLMTDLSELKEQSDSGETVRFAEIIGSMYRRGDYELRLKETEAKTKDCEIFEPDEVRKMELALVDREKETTVFLQKDSDLPKSRGCPVGYRLQDVYIYERAADQYNIAVFVNVFTPGFEGPDMRFMVVGGKLN